MSQAPAAVRSATSQSVQRHICIDFEGESKKKDGSIPTPHLLGAMVPVEGKRYPEYRVYLLRSELAPMGRKGRLSGGYERVRVCSLEEALDELLELARGQDMCIVGFSIHEKDVVERELPESSAVRREFLERWHNIKDDTDPLLSRLGFGRGQRTLEHAVRYLLKGFRLKDKPLDDVAESCRRLSAAGSKSRRWRNWAERHQALAADLLEYNRRDCRAVWELVGRVQRAERVSVLGPRGSRVQ